MAIEINKNKKKEFFVRITGNNGEILYSGEGLSRKASAMKQIISLAKQFNSVGFVVSDYTTKVRTDTAIQMGVDRTELSDFQS